MADLYLSSYCIVILFNYEQALDQLIAQKTVTVARMMELVPVGTVDPSPFVFDNTLMVCAGLQGCALLMNSALRPMPESTYDDAPEQLEIK